MRTGSRRAPAAGGTAKDAGDLGAARATAAVVGQPVRAELVPVALDEERAAGMAAGRLAVAVGHVARVRVAHPVGEGDAARADQGRRRRGRHVEQLVVGVEGPEVQRHVRPELIDHPAAAQSSSASESLCPGMSSVVISTHTRVSCTR